MSNHESKKYIWLIQYYQTCASKLTSRGRFRNYVESQSLSTSAVSSITGQHWGPETHSAAGTSQHPHSPSMLDCRFPWGQDCVRNLLLESWESQGNRGGVVISLGHLIKTGLSNPLGQLQTISKETDWGLQSDVRLYRAYCNAHWSYFTQEIWVSMRKICLFHIKIKISHI